jgi:hypothetical protein
MFAATEMINRTSNRLKPNSINPPNKFELDLILPFWRGIVKRQAFPHLLAILTLAYTPKLRSIDVELDQALILAKYAHVSPRAILSE